VMRFVDMSLDVICKWRPSLHIYSEKWREDGGGKRWKAREENRRERSGAGNHLTFSPGWWVQPGLKVVFVSSNKTVGEIRTCG
jgi:hypothetical protein